MADPGRVLVGAVMDRLMRALPSSGTEEGSEAAAAYAEGGEAALAEYYAALALDEVSTDDGTLLGLGKIRHPLRRKKKHHHRAAPAPTAAPAPAATVTPQGEKVAPPPSQPAPVPPAAVERAVTIVMVPVAQAATAPVSPPASAPGPAPQVEREYPQSPSTPAPKSDGGALVPILAILALAAGG